MRRRRRPADRARSTRRRRRRAPRAAAAPRAGRSRAARCAWRSRSRRDELGVRGGESFGRAASSARRARASRPDVDRPSRASIERRKRAAGFGELVDGGALPTPARAEHPAEPGERVGGDRRPRTRWSRSPRTRGLRRGSRRRAREARCRSGREVHAVERVVHDEDRRTLRPARVRVRRSTRRRRRIRSGPGIRGSCSSPPPTWRRRSSSSSSARSPVVERSANERIRSSCVG